MTTELFVLFDSFTPLLVLLDDGVQGGGAALMREEIEDMRRQIEANVSKTRSRYSF